MEKMEVGAPAHALSDPVNIEKKLQVMDRRYSSFAGTPDEMVFCLTGDGEIIYLNKAFENITGWVRSEWIGREFKDLLHTNEDVLSNIQSIKKDGAYIGGLNVTQLRNADGSYQMIEFYGIADERQNAFEERFFVVGKDITKREEMIRRYPSLIDCIGCGILVVDNDDVIQYVNQHLCEMLNFDRDDLLGKIGYELIVYPKQETIIKTENKRKEGISERSDVVLTKKSGEKIWVQIEGSLITDVDGMITGSIMIFIDITASKEAQEVFKKEHQIYKSIIESSLDSIIATDEDHRITEFNKSAERLFGYVREEIIGEQVSVLYGDRGHYDSVLRDMKINGYSENEVLNKRKNGELFYSYLSASAIRDDRGRITGYMGISKDITEKKQSDERIKQLAAIIEMIPDSVIVINGDGKIIYWNQGATEMFLWTTQEVMYREISEFFSLTKYDLHTIVQTAENKRYWAGERTLNKRNGETLHSYCRVSMLNDAFDSTACYLFVSTDITEKKLQDQASAQHQRMESLGRMAGSISHDLNNIFTPIILIVEMMKQDTSNPDVKESLEKINSYMRKGTKLVNRVLELANGRVQSFNPEIINLKELIEEVLNLVRESIPDSVELLTTGCDKPVEIFGDPNQLFQVFLNLLINARDAMPEGGVLALHIEKSVMKGQSWIEVKISDTGVGIKSEDLEKIFEPFFTTKRNGSGIGLATVQSIVKQHGGFVNVNSKEGHGTTFVSYFPVHHSEAPVITGHTGQEQLPNILVIDDEKEICFLLERILKRANYNPLIAHESTEGLDIFVNRFKEINAILTDMQMPNMDGIQLIENVRKIDPGCKIIIMSANDPETYQQRLDQIHAPIHGFLRKPFKKEKLLQVVSEVVKTKAQ